MKPDKWRDVRERIDEARERRAANVLAVAARAGVLVADVIETKTGANTRRPHRLRLLIEIDLVTGEVSGAAEPMTEPEPAPGLPS